MLTLHETTRRSFCQLGFLTMCVLPACAIFVVSYWLSQPERVREHEQLLRGQIGLNVRLANVVQVRPHTIRYEQIELADPETGNVLAAANSLDIAVNQRGAAWEFVEPTIHANGYEQLYAALDRHLRVGRTGEKLIVTANTVALKHTKAALPMKLHHVQAQCDYTATAAQAAVSFVAEEKLNQKPVTMRLVRNRQTQPVSVGFEVDTAGASLPVGLLQGILDTPLSAKSTFRGGMWAVLSRAGWTGELAGELAGIELDQLPIAGTTGQLTGQGNLTIDRARFSDGRIESVQGSFAAASGSIQQDIAMHLLSGLKLRHTRPLSTQKQGVPFEEIAFAFALDAQGLRLAGRCENGPLGTVLVDGAGPAIADPAAGTHIPATQLAAIVSPSEAPVAPLTTPNAMLARILPLPEVRNAVQSTPKRR